METGPWQCWKCGTSIEKLILPLSRREECPKCRAELHVCHMCVEYDPNVSDQCREDRAEAVSDKIRANFCDYFKLSGNAYKGGGSKSSAAKSELAALFGEGNSGDNSDLSGDVKELSKEEKAKLELAKLFGEDK